MKNVIIDGVEYVEKESLKGKKKMIVICDNRGLTMVGDVDLIEENVWTIIENARCIIKWGTSEHLAEIAEGPTTKTILGAKRDFMVRTDKIIGAYICGDKWNE